jgi:glycosyltransferase-like protein
MRALTIALLTYSTKARGGVVHTLSLAEELFSLGHYVHIYALSSDENFFRPVKVPYTLIHCPIAETETLEERVSKRIAIYEKYLSGLKADFDIYHAQDCISANALLELRNRGLIKFFVRTVHHVDDFRSQSLIDCQLKSITEPDYLIVVSELWKSELLLRFDVDSTLIHNGVAVERFSSSTMTADENSRFKQALGLDGCRVILSVGGIEPRKNTLTTLRAFARARTALMTKGQRLVWLIAGGVTLFDYADYRERFFAECECLDVRVGRDLRLLGAVSDEELGRLYQIADALVFPSVNEGWGLVALEAMAMGLPVIASRVPPMTEYLRNEENALLVEPMDYEDLARQVVRVLTYEELPKQLAKQGKETSASYSWQRTAHSHARFYERILAERDSGPMRRARL